MHDDFAPRFSPTLFSEIYHHLTQANGLKHLCLQSPREPIRHHFDILALLQPRALTPLTPHLHRVTDLFTEEKPTRLKPCSIFQW